MSGDHRKTTSHYNDVIMSTMASQITRLTIVYSTVYSGADQRKHQNSASLAFVRGIHRWPANYPHKGPVTRKIFPCDDVIMLNQITGNWNPVSTTNIPMPLTKWQGPGWWSQVTWPMLRNLLQSTDFTTVIQQTDHINLKRNDYIHI